MDNDPSAKGKGKARADDADIEVLHERANNESTLGERIIKSAKGLLRDSMAPGGDTPHALASSSLLGQKVIPAESRVERIGGSDMLIDPIAGRKDVDPDMEACWRSQGMLREGVPPPEGGLFSDQNIDQFAEGQFATLRPGDIENERSESSRQILEGTTQDTFDASWRRATAWERKAEDTDAKSLVHLNDDDDGAEVRAILADPTFNANLETSLDNPVEELHPAIDDLFPGSMAVHAGTWTQPHPHRTMPTDHPLSLKPRTEEENRTIEQNIGAILQGTFTSKQLSAEPADANDEWLADWLSVLNGYTDEVWGDMLPVVQETRLQLEQVKAGTTAIDSKAVARLKMIMGHLELNK